MKLLTTPMVENVPSFLLLLRHSVAPYAPLLITLLVVVFSYTILHLLRLLYLRPASLRQALIQQGIDTLPYRPLSGDFVDFRRLEALAQAQPLPSPSSHGLLFRYIFPFYHKRISQLQDDRPFVFWLGSLPVVILINPEDVKFAMLADVKHFQKEGAGTKDAFEELLGAGGLLLADGENWHSKRNLLRPAFFTEKLKEMVPDMAISAREMVSVWSKHVTEQGGRAEQEVAKDIKDATADILARTSFGSSYLKGRLVFEKQVEILELLSKLRVKNTLIPDYRMLPTTDNLRVRELVKAVNQELREIVESRRRAFHSSDKVSQTTGRDLLALILHAEEEEVKQGNRTVHLSTQEVMDICKTFFFAGHETTANLLAWTMMLLSLNQDWQERAREEVFEICGRHGEPKADHLNKMKIIGMVLNESLRLYPPVPEYGRRLLCPNQGNFKLGERILPQGTAVSMLTLHIHRRKDLWGQDADEFNPERFANGVAEACKHPHGFMPFGQGPRICIGQHFALMEAKAMMATILQQFRFSISPNYKHAPVVAITMRPKHGVQVILESLP